MDLDLGRQSIVEWAESAPEEGAADFVPAKDKYKIETSIGKGGMGEVFLATDKLKPTPSFDRVAPLEGGPCVFSLVFLPVRFWPVARAARRSGSCARS